MFSNHHLRYAPMYGAPLHHHQPTFESFDDFESLLVEDAHHSEQASELALLEALRLEEHGRHSRLDSYHSPHYLEPASALYTPVARYHQLAIQRHEAEARLRSAIVAREREQALLLEQQRIRQAEERARIVQAHRAAEQRRLIIERARAAEQQRLLAERARAAEERRLIEETERQLRARLQFRERLTRAREQTRLSEWRLTKDRDASRIEAERIARMIAIMKAHTKPSDIVRSNPYAASQGFQSQRACSYHAAPIPEKAVHFALPSPTPSRFSARTPVRSVPVRSEPSPAPQESLDPLFKLFFGENFIQRSSAPAPVKALEQPEISSQVELEKQFEALLKFFASNGSADAPSAASAPVAGPSGLNSNEKDRIPFEQKGKWRGPGIPAKNGEVEAQIAADAALAARLQAEENARARNNRATAAGRVPSPGGIVINEPVKSSPPAKTPGLVINEPKPSSSKSASPVSSSQKEPVVAATAAPEPSVEETKSTAIHALESISARFSTLTENFAFPATLDARLASPAPSISSASTFSTVVLPHTPTNAPVHAHTHALEKLLGELDAVESNGNEEVRMKRKELVGRVERALEGVEQSVAAASPAPADEKLETDFEEVQPVTANSAEPGPVSDLSNSTITHAAFSAEPVFAEPVPTKVESAEEEAVVVDAALTSAEPVGIDAPAVEVLVAVEKLVEESVVFDAPTPSESNQVAVDESPAKVDESSAAIEVAPEPVSAPTEEHTISVNASLASSEVTIRAPVSDTEDLALSFPAPEALASSGILATPASVVTTDGDEVDTFLLPASRPVSPRRVPAHADDSGEDEALLVDGMSSGEEWSDLEPEEK